MNRRTEARNTAAAILADLAYCGFGGEVNRYAVAEQLDAAGFADLAFSSILGAVNAAVAECEFAALDGDVITVANRTGERPVFEG